MNDTTRQQLDTLAQRIADALTAKRGTPTHVHQLHHADASAFCLGQFGAAVLVKAETPGELLAQGVGFLAGLLHHG